MKRRYRALDQIAFDGPPSSDSRRAQLKTASPGDVVELNEKDAKALLARGAVVVHDEQDQDLPTTKR